ncbi:hypothetical protein THAOC_14948 [Thalassiosira oceanica]|uniref:Uncharacterized protein n=1 Tax=Thalassiosira oceanica TaxID=159749 RepID=K0SG58_THAOC|nr:hypothetical protein THAOC_14948 [Thalassiosira oceanica]|eukprot:EJK64330.1 hypothetical protein THAOC_14948 [Thalassiosira oceanica]
MNPRPQQWVISQPEPDPAGLDFQTGIILLWQLPLLPFLDFGAAAAALLGRAKQGQTDKRTKSTWEFVVQFHASNDSFQIEALDHTLLDTQNSSSNVSQDDDSGPLARLGVELLRHNSMLSSSVEVGNLLLPKMGCKFGCKFSFWGEISSSKFHCYIITKSTTTIPPAI